MPAQAGDSSSLVIGPRAGMVLRTVRTPPVVHDGEADTPAMGERKTLTPAQASAILYGGRMKS